MDYENKDYEINNEIETETDCEEESESSVDFGSAAVLGLAIVGGIALGKKAYTKVLKPGWNKAKGFIADRKSKREDKNKVVEAECKEVETKEEKTEE